MPKHSGPGSAAPPPEKRKPGRPRKGYVKVLISLEPAQAEMLAHVALIRGAMEGRRKEVSELVREIFAKSDYWARLQRDAVAATEAINASSSAKWPMEERKAERRAARSPTP